tara:strand:+ start:637 stop:1101 length:465 start_codon:yes stop_codon:yes gene_type:complete
MNLVSLLPASANNNYEGNKYAIYGFYPLLAILLFRGLVHFLKEDAGLHDIATIIPFPIFDGIDPNNVIYLFGSLWGASQLIILFFYLIIFFKYRNLLHFIWITMIIDVLFRLISGTIHPLTPEYYINQPPGSIGNIYILIYSMSMFLLSIWKNK